MIQPVAEAHARVLASAPVPLACPPLPMYMIWHLRHQHNPAHSWLRQEIEAVTAQVLQQGLITVQ